MLYQSFYTLYLRLYANAKELGKRKKRFKRNLIANRVISVFSEQSLVPLITLGILQYFLHFLKAKNINSWLKWHQKKLHKGTRKNSFQSSKKLCKNTGKISFSFHQYFHLFNMNFKICFRYLVLLEIIVLVKILKTVAQNFA